MARNTHIVLLGSSGAWPQHGGTGRKAWRFSAHGQPNGQSGQRYRKRHGASCSRNDSCQYINARTRDALQPRGVFFVFSLHHVVPAILYSDAYRCASARVGLHAIVSARHGRVLQDELLLYLIPGTVEMTEP